MAKAVLGAHLHLARGHVASKAKCLSPAHPVCGAHHGRFDCSLSCWQKHEGVPGGTPLFVLRSRKAEGWDACGHRQVRPQPPLSRVIVAATAALAAAGGDQCHHHCGQDRRRGHLLHAPAEPSPAERSVSGPRGRGDLVAWWCFGRSRVAQAEVVDVWLEAGQRWARASCRRASWDGKRPDGSNQTSTQPFPPPGTWAGKQRGPNGGEAAAVQRGIPRQREPRENTEGTTKIEERSNWKANRRQRKRKRRNAERLVEEGEERRKGVCPEKHSASEEREAAEGKNERVRRSTERGKSGKRESSTGWKETAPTTVVGPASVLKEAGTTCEPQICTGAWRRDGTGSTRRAASGSPSRAVLKLLKRHRRERSRWRRRDVPRGPGADGTKARQQLINYSKKRK